MLPAVDHIGEIVVSGAGGLALLGWGVVVLLRGAAPAMKAAGRAWRSAGEAAMFGFLLGAALLVVAFMWTATATGFAGPGGVIGSDAGLVLGLVPLLLGVLAVVFCGPRKVAELRGNP
ncbi:hypothetical protein Areg01_15080 [Actinoplanes regularis]|nr:hypothetical protein Areg01_15080 [Actinoplanes regularis]